MDDFDDNIFDEDDALDYMIYEDIEKQNNRQDNQGGKGGGCLGMILILVIPTVAVGWLSIQL